MTTLVPGVQDRLNSVLLPGGPATAAGAARVMLMGTEQRGKIPSSSSLAAVTLFLQEVSVTAHLTRQQK